MSDFEKKLANLGDTIGELQIPYQILNSFEFVEAYIQEQVKVANRYYSAEIVKKREILFPCRQENAFLIAAYSVIVNEITSYSRGCFTWWPLALPDPKKLAIDAHKKVEAELFEVHFRDTPQLLDRCRIDYDRVITKRRTSQESFAPAATPAPAAAVPDSTDPEAPADA